MNESRALRIINVDAGLVPYVKIDEWVALSIRCSQDPLPQPFYARYGDMKHSLLEVAMAPDDFRISAKAGTFCGLTIVSFAQSDLRSPTREPDAIESRIGVPIVDVSNWEGSPIRDKNVPFTLSVTSDGIQIWFANPVEPKIRYDAGQTHFCATGRNKLIGVSVDGLGHEDMCRLDKAHGLKRP